MIYCWVSFLRWAHAVDHRILYLHSEFLLSRHLPLQTFPILAFFTLLNLFFIFLLLLDFFFALGSFFVIK